MEVSRGVFVTNLIRLLVLLATLATLCQFGCDQGPEGDVLAQYRRGEDAIAIGDAVGYRNILSTASVEYLNETLRLAKEAGEKEAKEISLDRLPLVLALRNRAGSKLKTMTLDELLIWEMKEGMLMVDKDIGLEPWKVYIKGTHAKMQYAERVEVERTGRARFGRRGLGALAAAASGSTTTKLEPVELYADFENIGGFWYVDLTVIDPTIDDEIIQEAKTARKSVPDFLAQREGEEHGSLIKNVWAPPK